MLGSHGCHGKLFHVVLKEDEEGVLTLTWEYENELLEQQRRLLGKYVLATCVIGLLVTANLYHLIPGI
jgi:hypothetical protein